MDDVKHRDWHLHAGGARSRTFTSKESAAQLAVADARATSSRSASFIFQKVLLDAPMLKLMRLLVTVIGAILATVGSLT
jgi:hypothetical protein